VPARIERAAFFNRGSSTGSITRIDAAKCSRAAALGVFFERNFPIYRIAIVCLPAKARMVANLASWLAGKVAVDLNFTAGRGANESAPTRRLARCNPARRSWNA